MITWNIIRAAGIGAYLMLWASVTWGLISTTAVFRPRTSKATTVALHQAFSTSGLILLATHLYFLLKDKFLPFTWVDLLIPMHTTYRPIGVALGIGALFCMLLGVLSTSWGRKLIGTKWWRRTHTLAIPAFALALVHGLMAGSDTRRPMMWWMYVGTACVVLFLLFVRAFTAGEKPKRKPLPEGVSRKAPSAAAVPAAATSPAPARPGHPPATQRRVPIAPHPEFVRIPGGTHEVSVEEPL
jgi:hypothetical protein